MSRTARLWILRLVALGLVAFVLASQLEWEDRLDRRDGTHLTGRVTQTADGGWRVEPPGSAGGRPVAVAAADVAVRATDGAEVPQIAWGLRTLGERLGGSLPAVGAVLLLLATLLVLTAWRWRLLLRTVDLYLPFARTVRLTFIGVFFNTAVPGATGGDVVKAWYAALATGRGTRSVVSVFVDRVVGLLGLAVFAGGVLLLAPRDTGYGPARVVVAVVLGATLVGGAILLDRRLRRLVGLSWLVRRLPFQTLQAEAHAALRLYRNHPVALGAALVVSLANHAANAFAVWLLASALGVEGLDLATTMALVPVANLFAAIPILPGGWGVGELAFAYMFGQVGVPPTEAVGLSVVYRLSMLVVGLPGGLLWLFWRDRPTRAAIERRMEEVAHEVEVREATA